MGAGLLPKSRCLAQGPTPEERDERIARLARNSLISFLWGGEMMNFCVALPMRAIILVYVHLMCYPPYNPSIDLLFVCKKEKVTNNVRTQATGMACSFACSFSFTC